MRAVDLDQLPEQVDRGRRRVVGVRRLNRGQTAKSQQEGREASMHNQSRRE
jgi:hypothetical protein